MFTRLAIALFALGFYQSAVQAQQPPIPAHIDSLARPVLQRWVSGGWRPATKDDALRGKSADTRNFLNSEFRAMANHPFFVSRDFNKDGHSDFAVMLIKGKRYALAIFNGPFRGKAKPNFYSNRIEPGDFIFWFNDEHGRRFIIGPPASDSGFVLIPRGKTYRVG